MGLASVICIISGSSAKMKMARVSSGRAHFLLPALSNLEARLFPFYYIVRKSFSQSFSRVFYTCLFQFSPGGIIRKYLIQSTIIVAKEWLGQKSVGTFKMIPPICAEICVGA
eukprot:TRINITY_DN48762_c0_g1_i1.p1 TRINITY_DN48762_c0_g1~~TRINITY_DN48762_c0_g1_i1.p1  ORF type:complete len:112 (-),score=13.69 TRINITY_DN48762_c0_g1_i1:212-547(-)